MDDRINKLAQDDKYGKIESVLTIDESNAKSRMRDYLHSEFSELWNKGDIDLAICRSRDYECREYKEYETTWLILRFTQSVNSWDIWILHSILTGVNGAYDEFKVKCGLRINKVELAIGSVYHPIELRCRLGKDYGFGMLTVQQKIEFNKPSNWFMN